MAHRRHPHFQSAPLTRPRRNSRVHPEQPGWYALVVEDQAGRQAYTDPIWIDPAGRMPPPGGAALVAAGCNARFTACRADPHHRAAVRRLRGLLLLPRGPLGGDAAAGRGAGPAGHRSRRGAGAHRRHHLPRRARLCARQVLPHRARGLLGRAAQLSHRRGRRRAFHLLFGLAGGAAAVHARLDRQPPDAVARLGRARSRCPPSGSTTPPTARSSAS